MKFRHWPCFDLENVWDLFFFPPPPFFFFSPVLRVLWISVEETKLVHSHWSLDPVIKPKPDEPTSLHMELVHSHRDAVFIFGWVGTLWLITLPLASIMVPIREGETRGLRIWTESPQGRELGGREKGGRTGEKKFIPTFGFLFSSDVKVLCSFQTWTLLTVAGFWLSCLIEQIQRNPARV